MRHASDATFPLKLSVTKMDTHRTYDLVLYGATGYTGQYTAEWLQENAPTDLKWAVAGRNAQKLEAIATTLKELNPDRLQPGKKPSCTIVILEPP